MAEVSANPSVVTPSAPLPGDSSASSAAPVTPTPESNAPAVVSEAKPEGSPESAREAIVKSLLERRAARDAGKSRLPRSSTDAPVVKLGSKAAEADASTPSVESAETAKDADSTDASAATEKAPEKKEVKPEEIDGDPKLAKRIAYLAKKEDTLRQAEQIISQQVQQLEVHKDSVNKWHDFTSKFSQDPVQALQALGLQEQHLDALFWKLNDSVLQRAKKPDPVESARAEARKEFERLQQQQQQSVQQGSVDALNEARRIYAQNVAQTFEANKAKYPAIASLGIPTQWANHYAEATFQQTRQMPAPEKVLEFFENYHQQRIEAAGYGKAAPKIEAPKGQKTDRPTTVTGDWSAGATTVSDSKPKSLNESRQEIKRKLDAGFYKRQAR